MLEKMRIKMSSAKALKYFKMCDVDDSGEIDFEESPSAGRSSNGRLQRRRDAFLTILSNNSGGVRGSGPFRADPFRGAGSVPAVDGLRPRRMGAAWIVRGGRDRTVPASTPRSIRDGAASWR